MLFYTVGFAVSFPDSDLSVTVKNTLFFFFTLLGLSKPVVW